MLLNHSLMVTIKANCYLNLFISKSRCEYHCRFLDHEGIGQVFLHIYSPLLPVDGGYGGQGATVLHTARHWLGALEHHAIIIIIIIIKIILACILLLATSKGMLTQQPRVPAASPSSTCHIIIETAAVELFLALSGITPNCCRSPTLRQNSMPGSE